LQAVPKCQEVEIIGNQINSLKHLSCYEPECNVIVTPQVLPLKKKKKNFKVLLSKKSGTT
jgi:hypothetical protein